MLLQNFTRLICLARPSDNGVSAPDLVKEDGLHLTTLNRANVSYAQVLPNSSNALTVNNQLTIYNAATGATASMARGYNYGAYTLFVGTGTNQVSFTDYALTRETTLTSVGVPNPTVNSSGIFTISHTLQNNTSADVTITEIGLARAGDDTSNTISVASHYILLTRDVFDTPITIPAGEARTFTVTIDHNNFSTGYN